MISGFAIRMSIALAAVVVVEAAVVVKTVGRRMGEVKAVVVRVVEEGVAMAEGMMVVVAVEEVAADNARLLRQNKFTFHDVEYKNITQL